MIQVNKIPGITRFINIKDISATVKRTVLTLFIFLFAFIPELFSQEERPVFGGKDFISNGLQGKIYKLPEDTRALPDFDKMKPLGFIYTDRLDVPMRSWTAGFPEVPNLFEWFGIEYNAMIRVKRPGKYIFRLLSDDGSKLFIDGTLVIDNDGVHGVSSKQGVYDLDLSTHSIKIQYFQGPRTEIALQVFASFENETEQIFPGNDFKLSTPRENKEDKTLPLILFTILLSLALDLIPGVGTIKGGIEAFTGRDLITGEELTWWERGLGILPYGNALRKLNSLRKITGNLGNAMHAMNQAGDILKGTDNISNAGKAIGNVPGSLKGITNTVETIFGGAESFGKAGNNISDGLKNVEKLNDATKHIDDLEELKKLKEFSPDLEKAMKEFRKTNGIERKIVGSRVQGGTTAAAKPRIEGFSEDIITEGSTRSKGKSAKTVKNNDRYQSPQAFGGTKNHAEQNVLGNLADELDSVFKTKADAKGSVYMKVEQEVCSPCRQGLRNPDPDILKGVIKQFSEEYPNVKLIIDNQRTAEVLIVQNGKILN